MEIVNVDKLVNIIESKFSEIVVRIEKNYINELRIYIIDDSFLDVWFSLKLENRYSYHWERKEIDNSIFRHDNTPHIKWKYVNTFPKHFHNKTEENVESSHISDKPEDAIVEIMNFILDYFYKSKNK